MRYHYRGVCPVSGDVLALPRTTRAELLVTRLVEQMGHRADGKMLGVLVVETDNGLAVLKAFSGLWDGQPARDGWVPPIGGTPPASTEFTLQRLEALKAELVRLVSQRDALDLDRRTRDWDLARAALETRLRQARDRRHAARNEGSADPRLDDESRADGRERRQFRRQRDEALAPLVRRQEELESRVLDVKRERRRLSRTLQAEMHRDFERTLTGDAPWSLASLFPRGLPTGTGDCCAPKLLYCAALHGWRPVEMAEVWCGPPSADGNRQTGVFYGACEQRCQPLLGPLLSRRGAPIRILLADDSVLAVEKPSGLLTVPGRAHWKQDALRTRVERIYPDVLAVHRLDLETSGIVLFARTAEAQANLHKQFADRAVYKVYHAALLRRPDVDVGTIDAPLGPDPDRPGCYHPDAFGKAATTHYRMLDGTNVELTPETGRSHQLRVHLAVALGCPIRGDRLYGDPNASGSRLHLHATTLRFRHPVHGGMVTLESPPPW